jgi:nitric oxide reductase NorE protein
MSSTEERRIPAEPGWWTFVAGDLIAFGILFATFVYYRALAPESYATALRTLSVPLGLLNTLFLLTGSLFVARGVEAYRLHKYPLSARLFSAGVACGLAFGGVKVVEWGIKFSHGITPLTGEPFMFYFMMTGIHLLHVTVGVVFLVVLALKMASGKAQDNDRTLVEIGGIFWHLVDLIWIVLFPLLYLTV